MAKAVFFCISACPPFTDALNGLPSVLPSQKSSAQAIITAAAMSSRKGPEVGALAMFLTVMPDTSTRLTHHR